MTQVKDSSLCATLLADVRGSRRAADRQALHRTLSSALAAAAAEVPADEDPRLTVGDEFQARYRTVGQALHAAWWIRLQVLPEVDLRFGIGWGPVTRLDAQIQDGPGWWAARTAIEATKVAESRPVTRHLRTTYHLAAGHRGPQPEPVNAALLCRDHLVGSLDQRSLHLLKGLATAMTKAELAADLGISASAVSQRTTGQGIDAVLESQRLLAAVA